MLGDVLYYSESGPSDVCGSIDVKHFPYKYVFHILFFNFIFSYNLSSGKENRHDIYQSPYVWVQFTNITPLVLISVECRIFGANIFYDKIAQRGSVRFQLYLNKNL